MSDDPVASDALARARRLAEDLNMTTLGWQMPSDRIIEDFAHGEHRLVAREHRFTDVEGAGGSEASRRAFSLYASDADASRAEPFALLIEPSGPGTWRLLIADAGRAAGPR